MRRSLHGPGNISLGNASDGTRAQFFSEWGEIFDIVCKALDITRVEVVRRGCADYPALGRAEAAKLWLCRQLVEITQDETRERIETHLVSKARKLIEEVR